MTSIIQSLTKRVGTTVVVALLVLGVAVPAQAQTVESLTAQLNALIAQLNALRGTTTVSMTFTRDLTIGSTGADVTALQNWLIGKGYSIPAGATGYFGTQTQAALAAYQAASGISPAAGYFGPITRGRINASVVVTPTPTPTPTPSPDDDDFFGGNDEGFLDEFDQLSSLSSEEVGEGEEDVEVLGVEFEATDADQMITRTTVEFDTPTGSDDLEDFIDSVSIMLDGEVLATMDIEDASHSASADRYTFRFTGLDGIVEEGSVGELTVAVTAANNVDSDDEGDGWTVTIPEDGIRAVSPNGVDDTYAADAFDETFTVETFAAATGVELIVGTSDDSPEGGIITVDTSDETDGVELLRFTLEADGSDLEVSEIPVTLTVTGATDVDAVINRLTLDIDGEERSETVTSSSASQVITFDDLDLMLEDGEEVEVIVYGDINELSGSFEAGDTLSADITTSNRDAIEAEDESGEDLEDADKRGTANGDEFAFFAQGIAVTFVSAEEDLEGNDGADNDTGTFTIKYRVEAIDDTIYVSDSAAATTANDITASTISTNGVLYLLDESGTPSVDDVTSAVSYRSIEGNVTDSSNGVKIDEGEVAEFTLTVVRTNNGDASDDGLFRVLLKAIGWNTNDSTTFNVYDFDLEDYKTGFISIN